MRSFSVEGEIRNVAGMATPFRASVSDPSWKLGRFVVALDWHSAGIYREFTGPYAEAVYRRACAFVRSRLWRSGMELLVEGMPVEFMPPVFAPSDVQFPLECPFSFDVVQIDGVIRDRGGAARDAMIRIGPPFRTGESSSVFGNSCYFSEFGELGPTFLITTDEAYAGSFRLIRSLLRKRGLRLTDTNGQPLAVTALEPRTEQ